MKGQAKKRIGERGISWQITVELPRDAATGKRRQKLLTAPTKKEVEAMAAQLLSKAEDGTLADVDTKKLTVEQYLERWLESISKSIKPASHRVYADLMRKHTSPVIGKVQLSRLSPLDVQRLYAKKIEAGLSSSTVEMLHNILHRALKQAVRWNLVIRNVTEAVDPPRAQRPELVTWNDRQVAAFLAVSDQDELAVLWRLALFTGLRRGEILGLKWADLDLERKKLDVKRTYSRGDGSSFDFGQPKTTHGRRTVILPSLMVDTLRKHRKKQVEARLAVAGYQDHDLVFADALGEPIHPNTLRKHFVKLIAKAQVPAIRFHDMRHTHATLLMKNNVNPKIVSERLGHANVGITLDHYSHVSEDMQRQAAEGIERLIEGHEQGGAEGVG